MLLEPEIARLAAERVTGESLETLRASVAAEREARTAAEAHDASRAFHAELVRATGNEALLRIFDSLWIADVGRRLLARRRTQPDWQDTDAAEHEELLSALETRDGDRAALLMRTHVEAAWRHWSGVPAESPREGGTGGTR